MAITDWQAGGSMDRGGIGGVARGLGSGARMGAGFGVPGAGAAPRGPLAFGAGEAPGYQTPGGWQTLQGLPQPMPWLSPQYNKPFQSPWAPQWPVMGSPGPWGGGLPPELGGLGGIFGGQPGFGMQPDPQATLNQVMGGQGNVADVVRQVAQQQQLRQLMMQLAQNPGGFAPGTYPWGTVQTQPAPLGQYNYGGEGGAQGFQPFGIQQQTYGQVPFQATANIQQRPVVQQPLRPTTYPAQQPVVQGAPPMGQAPVQRPVTQQYPGGMQRPTVGQGPRVRRTYP